jgi:hypothetical protein
MRAIQRYLPKLAKTFSDIDGHCLKKTYTEHSKLIVLPKKDGPFYSYAFCAPNKV